MALQALSSNDLLSSIIYDTIYVAPRTCQDSSDNIFSLDRTINVKPQGQQGVASLNCCSKSQHRKRQRSRDEAESGVDQRQNSATQGKKKRRRKSTRVGKKKEEAEIQRLTHIALERNRRKQMNDHLSVLRSLMPQSYVQRGDQASIVGGAIEYVKELEHFLQTLEAKKLQLLQQQMKEQNVDDEAIKLPIFSPSLFSQLFSYDQYLNWSQNPRKFTSKCKTKIADIEVTLIETHASLRILLRRNPKLFPKLVASFQAFQLTILHLNVTTTSPLAFYSISAKVEEGCQLRTADDISSAVYHILQIIEDEAVALS